MIMRRESISAATTPQRLALRNRFKSELRVQFQRREVVRIHNNQHLLRATCTCNTNGPTQQGRTDTAATKLRNDTQIDDLECARCALVGQQQAADRNSVNQHDFPQFRIVSPGRTMRCDYVVDRAHAEQFRAILTVLVGSDKGLRERGIRSVANDAPLKSGVWLFNPRIDSASPHVNERREVGEPSRFEETTILDVARFNQTLDVVKRTQIESVNGCMCSPTQFRGENPILASGRYHQDARSAGKYEGGGHSDESGAARDAEQREFNFGFGDGSQELCGEISRCWSLTGLGQEKLHRPPDGGVVVRIDPNHVDRHCSSEFVSRLGVGFNRCKIYGIREARTFPTAARESCCRYGERALRSPGEWFASAVYV